MQGFKAKVARTGGVYRKLSLSIFLFVNLPLGIYSSCQSLCSCGSLSQRCGRHLFSEAPGQWRWLLKTKKWTEEKCIAHVLSAISTHKYFCLKQSAMKNVWMKSSPVFIILKSQILPIACNLTCSRRAYYIFFWSPVRDYFQWKFGKNFSVNETMSGQWNKHPIHWHFEN